MPRCAIDLFARPSHDGLDRETCAALWDKDADLRDCELEKKYHDTIGADANALVVGQKREAEAETPAASGQGPPKKRRKKTTPKATKRKATGARVWWKDYVCPKKVGQPVKRKCTPAKATVKRVRK